MANSTQTQATWEKTAWVPRKLPGGIYCSPACGCRCELKQFEKVTKAAAKLAKRLGPNWKPWVWENGGWNYRAVIDWKQEQHQFAIEVHERKYTIGPTTYDCWIQTSPQFIVDGFKTPEKAVEAAFKAMNKYIKGLQKQQTYLREMTNG